MTDTRPFWQRIHWMVYALLAPLVIMGSYRLLVGSGTKVEVVGSGVLTQLTEEHAPEGSRYALDVVEAESSAETERRVMDHVSGWPDILVIGFDESLATQADGAAVFARVAQAAENATSVPVLVGFAESPDWFSALCETSSLRLCVEPGDDPAAAIAAGVDEAWQRHRALEASTQVGR